MLQIFYIKKKTNTCLYYLEFKQELVFIGR